MENYIIGEPGVKIQGKKMKKRLLSKAVSFLMKRQARRGHLASEQPLR
jgi:hypothetical protein